MSQQYVKIKYILRNYVKMEQKQPQSLRKNKTKFIKLYMIGTLTLSIT